VPSTPATYGYLHRHYGRLDWPTVVGPAIRLARDGYLVTPLQQRLQERELEAFLAAPGGSGARYFLRDGRRPWSAGSRFRQPELADLLERIARGGAEAFYTGDVAAQIDADMQRHDGFLRADDLAFVPWPIERRPVQRRYRDVLVATTPPPGAGRTLLLALMTLGQLRSRFVREHGPRRNHFFAEALRKVFLTRRNRPFDPATWPQVRDKLMLSRAYARQVAQSIADEMDVQLPFEDPPDEERDTTHFSVMDREGGVVSMTQSVELV
jgi:gamma-glutamyltranspeptidase/glutathione hydrolase